MRLALFQPDIPQNTGTIMRLAACLNVEIDIIGPTGFDMSERALKRAALDYLPHVNLTRHLSYNQFNENRPPKSRVILLTTAAKIIYTDFQFGKNDILLLGRESKGVTKEVHDHADHRIKIPMRPGLRSLNIAVSASMVLGEALRQLNAFPTADDKTVQDDP